MYSTRLLFVISLCGGVLLTGCPDAGIDSEKDGWIIENEDMNTPTADMMQGDQGPSTPDMQRDQGTTTPPDQGPIVVEPDMPPDMQVQPDLPVGEPNLVAPITVSFGDVTPGLQVNKIISLSNDGSEPLELQNIVVSPAVNSPFAISYPDPNAPDDLTRDKAAWTPTLGAGEAIPARVTFAPNNPGAAIARIFISSNDPDTPQTEIKLDGNAGTPCVRFAGVQPANATDYVLNFDQSSIGTTNQKSIVIENCSRNQDLAISDVVIGDDAGGVFAISQWEMPAPGSNAVIIPPQGTKSLKIGYTPTDETTHNGTLSLNTSDPVTPTTTFRLSGSGTNNSCPVAVAEGRVMGSTGRAMTTISTVPLTTIELDGSMSQDPDGSVQRHEWSIVSKPANSTTVLAPSSTIVNPRIFLDLAGQYELALTVYDDQNVASCASASILINATYSTDVGIELVWDTPADSDQTDTFGTDLDLHYMRPGGDWDNATYDVYWQNPEGDWGIPGDPTDNPSLDIDDTDGSGPEFISHDNPTPDLYKVGAYYYNDNGFGPSYATLRIYVGGMLMFEQRDKYLERENTFWDVATIDWPSQTILLVDRVSSGFP